MARKKRKEISSLGNDRKDDQKLTDFLRIGSSSYALRPSLPHDFHSDRRTGFESLGGGRFRRRKGSSDEEDLDNS